MQCILFLKIIQNISKKYLKNIKKYQFRKRIKNLARPVAPADGHGRPTPDSRFHLRRSCRTSGNVATGQQPATCVPNFGGRAAPVQQWQSRPTTTKQPTADSEGTIPAETCCF
jgi:hypothetical protein